MFKKFIFFLLSTFFLHSCLNDPKLIFDTETPEYAIKKWQNLVDSSKFDDAKSLSTERTIKWLEKYQSLTDGSDSLSYQMNFTMISCKISGDSAICSCKYTINEDSMINFETYNLKKINHKWLVDLSHDEIESF